MSIYVSRYSGEEVIDTLAPMAFYNVVILDWLVSINSDCEGSMAIGANVQFNLASNNNHAYTIGDANPVNQGWESSSVGKYVSYASVPSLILGGRAEPDSATARVCAGNSVLKKSYLQDYLNNSFRFTENLPKDEVDKMVDTFFQKPD